MPQFRIGLLSALLLSLSAHLLLAGWLLRKAKTATRNESHHSAHVEVGLIESAPHSQAVQETSKSAAPVPRFPKHVKPAAPNVTASAEVDAATKPGNSASPNALGEYIAELRRRIDRAKVYPALASAREQEGTVTIGLTINADGTIRSAEIESAAGFAALNTAALDAVRALKGLPPLPTGLPVHLHVPVAFRIEH